MKKRGILLLCCLACLTLTACSPYDLKYKYQDFMTTMDRKWTEFRLWFEGEWEDVKIRFNLEKDNVEDLWDNRNLDKEDDALTTTVTQSSEFLNDYDETVVDTQKSNSESSDSEATELTEGN